MTRPDRRQFLAGLGALGFLAACGRTEASAPPSVTSPAVGDAVTQLPSTTPSATPTAVSESPASTEGNAPLPVLSVPVIRREGWDARPPKGPLQRHTVKRLTLHHTEVLTQGVPSTERARGHQAYHMGTLGYSDIAYHFLVDMDGNILEGRDVAYRGETETSYDTTGHFLVCCEGNFDVEHPTTAMLTAVSELFGWASETYDISPTTIQGHRDYAPGEKTCPGKYLEREISNGHLKAMTERLVRTRDVKLDYLSVAAAKRKVARIEARAAP